MQELGPCGVTSLQVPNVSSPYTQDDAFRCLWNFQLYLQVAFSLCRQLSVPLHVSARLYVTCRYTVVFCVLFAIRNTSKRTEAHRPVHMIRFTAKQTYNKKLNIKQQQCGNTKSLSISKSCGFLYKCFGFCPFKISELNCILSFVVLFYSYKDLKGLGSNLGQVTYDVGRAKTSLLCPLTNGNRQNIIGGKEQLDKTCFLPLL